MDQSLSFWVGRFTVLFTLWAAAISVCTVVMLGLWYPGSRWVFHDIWQLAPLEKWLRYMLGSLVIAVPPAGFFTLYGWISHCSASLSRRWAVSIVIVAVLLGVEYFGIQFVKQHLVPALLRYLA